MNGLLVDCICRTTKDSIRSNIKRTVLLTSPENTGDARRVVASVMPPGSTCDGGVWRTPNDNIISIKRYEDDAPAYPGAVALKICSGGDPLSVEERIHVQRWRRTVSTLGS
jgi:hypothetical protein